MSYLDVFDIQLPTYRHGISRGDFVRLGENAGPLYEVMMVSGERAWVRNPSFGSDSIVCVHRCRRIGPTCSDFLQ
jgi:hypothetical protein